MCTTCPARFVVILKLYFKVAYRLVNFYMTSLITSLSNPTPYSLPTHLNCFTSQFRPHFKASFTAMLPCHFQLSTDISSGINKYKRWKVCSTCKRGHVVFDFLALGYLMQYGIFQSHPFSYRFHKFTLHYHWMEFSGINESHF